MSWRDYFRKKTEEEKQKEFEKHRLEVMNNPQNFKIYDLIKSAGKRGIKYMTLGKLSGIRLSNKLQDIIYELEKADYVGWKPKSDTLIASEYLSEDKPQDF